MRPEAAPKTGMADKQPIIGIRQRGGKTVAKLVPATDTQTLTDEIQVTVEPGSTLYTDDHGAYRFLSQHGYTHEALNHSE